MEQEFHMAVGRRPMARAQRKQQEERRIWKKDPATDGRILWETSFLRWFKVAVLFWACWAAGVEPQRREYQAKEFGQVHAVQGRIGGRDTRRFEGDHPGRPESTRRSEARFIQRNNDSKSGRQKSKKGCNKKRRGTPA